MNVRNTRGMLLRSVSGITADLHANFFFLACKEEEKVYELEPRIARDANGTVSPPPR
jgi:hypothetical protein